MADEMKQVYCMDRPNDNSALWASLMSNRENPAELATLMNQSNQWNNPMMYLVWMWMMRWMNGNGWDGNGAENYNSRAISQLQSSVDNNHNNDLVMQAIQGNGGAIHELASNLNCDFNTLQTAICGVKSAIESVAGQVGYSAEKVINAVNLGDAGITSKLQECCCQTKTAILEQGYQNQLANERQTNVLGSKIDAFASQMALSNCQQTNTLERAIENNRQAVVNGFAQIGYQMASDKSEIIQAGNANTQRILDQMCANTTQTLRDTIAQKDRELQSQTIINQLRKECGCNCGC